MRILLQPGYQTPEGVSNVTGRAASDMILFRPSIQSMLILVKNDLKMAWGSGGGSVGRAVASDTRDLQFEYQHQQSFMYQFLLNRKDKKEMEKEAGNGPSLRKLLDF